MISESLMYLCVNKDVCVSTQNVAEQDSDRTRGTVRRYFLKITIIKHLPKKNHGSIPFRAHELLVSLFCRDGILERHFLSRFLGINSSLFRLEFLSGFLPSFFRSTKCYSLIDSSFLVSHIF
jgi:hypothetical protein